MSTSDQPDTRTYRGGSLEEVLPKIRDELGPDAVITRQRDGLAGGVGGFFQRQFVEVEARPGGRTGGRFEAFDTGDEDALGAAWDEAAGTRGVDEATVDALRSPTIQAMLEQAAPFADQLNAAQAVSPPVAQPTGASRQPSPPLPVPATATAERPPSADAHERRLVASGLSPDLAAAVVTETITHLLPFASPRQLKRLVRSALARRIPVAPAPRADGRRVLAFVGPSGTGKTLCAARVAAGYAAAGRLPVRCLALGATDGAALSAALGEAEVEVHPVSSGREARAHLDAADDAAVVVIDTPGISPRDLDAVDELATELGSAAPAETHLALPATISATAAVETLSALEGLGVTHLALTHADETAHVGPVIDLAVRSGRPLSYLSRGQTLPGGLEIADAAAVAALVLP